MMVNMIAHTSALQCAVPAYIVRCIDGFTTLCSADPGNDLTLMRNFASMAIDGGPVSIWKPPPGHVAAAERAILLVWRW